MGIFSRTRTDAAGVKVDPAVLYQCLDGHVSAAGSFREGDTLRGSHPGVLAAPQLWAPVGLSDDEVGVLRAAYMARAALPVPEYRAETSDGQPVNIVGGPPTSPDGLLVATESMPAAGGYAAISAGALVPSGSPVARARPRKFRAAHQADLPVA